MVVLWEFVCFLNIITGSGHRWTHKRHRSKTVMVMSSIWREWFIWRAWKTRLPERTQELSFWAGRQAAWIWHPTHGVLKVPGCLDWQDSPNLCYLLHACDSTYNNNKKWTLKHLCYVRGISTTLPRWPLKALDCVAMTKLIHFALSAAVPSTMVKYCWSEPGTNVLPSGN